MILHLDIFHQHNITDHVVGVAQFMNRGILTTLAAASLAVRFGHVIRVRLDLSQG